MSIIIRRSLPNTPLVDIVDLPPLLQRIYAFRGIQSAYELENTFKHLLHFKTLTGILAFVKHLYTALNQQHHILIVGDFDADGATSTALAVLALRAMGAKQVSYLVPNRFEFGYGLTPEIVAVAHQRNPQVIITVDNGISSIEGVDYANTLGIKVLITDHHLPAERLPKAAAIVNPNLLDDPFPSKNLAGVGVIFYVLSAFRDYLRQQNWFEQQQIVFPNMADLLDLVALGTVADVVPLDHNNRILVQQGLKRIQNNQHRPGIQALLHVANIQHHHITANQLGFSIAPRLNAAGRLQDMSLGIECLLADNLITALPLAQQLDTLNKKRREIETTMQQQAISALSTLKLTEKMPMGLCLHNPAWHQGVIGIVASRIKERVHRPVIAFASVSEDELKGSARSISGLHIRDVLDAVAKRHPTLIQKFGGHAMAAGLSLKKSNFIAFSQAFAQEVSLHLSLADLEPRLLSDGALSQAEINLNTALALRNAGPWGQAFPEPLFDNQFYMFEQYLVASKHLKMSVGLSENSAPIPAIAFFVDLQKWPNHRVQRIHAAYRLDINEYQGKQKIQLLVESLDVFLG